MGAGEERDARALAGFCRGFMAARVWTRSYCFNQRCSVLLSALTEAWARARGFSSSPIADSARVAAISTNRRAMQWQAIMASIALAGARLLNISPMIAARAWALDGVSAGGVVATTTSRRR